MRWLGIHSEFEHFMKNLISIILAMSLFLTACADTKNIDGITYDTYGLLNDDEKKNPDIEYDIVWGNLVWSVILCKLIIPPIYFIGFSMFEPVGKKQPNAIKGQVRQ